MLLLYLSLFVVLSFSISSAPDNCVRFWEHDLGTGANWDKCIGTHHSMPFGNKASSFEVGFRVKARVCAGQKMEPPCIDAKPGQRVPFFTVDRTRMNDRIYSAKIESDGVSDGCVRFWEHDITDGLHWDVCKSTPNLPYGNKIGSFQVGKGVSVAVFKEPDYKGSSISAKSMENVIYDKVSKAGMNAKVFSVKFNPSSGNGGYGGYGGGEAEYDPEKGCYNYEGEYRPGFKQCGYDKEHFKSKTTDEATAEDVGRIDKILDDMEHDFKKKGDEEIKKVKFAFKEKKDAYSEAGRLQGIFELKQLARMNKEDSFDEARYAEELAHAAYVKAVKDYNEKVEKYRSVWEEHAKNIDFLNYELFIVHQIRELLGPKLGKEKIIQVVLKYEPKNKKWEDFEFKYKDMKKATFDHKKQRFEGGIDPGFPKTRRRRRRRRR